MDLLTCAKRDYSRLGWALLLMTVVSVGMQFVIGFILGFLETVIPGIYDSELGLFLMTVIPIYLTAMPVGCVLLRAIPGDSVQPMKLPGKKFAVLMVICAPILYGGNLIGTMLSMLLSGGTAENGLVEMMNTSPLFTGVLAVLIAPFAEEFIFRKQIIDRVGRYGEILAILISGLTFGLYHMNLFQFFYAFGLGILLAYVYTRTRMLRYPVIMHMIINFVGSVLAPWVLSRVDMQALDAFSMGELEMEEMLSVLPGLLLVMAYSSLLMLLSVVGFVLLILQWKKRAVFRTPAEVPEGKRLGVAVGNPGMILFILVCLVMMVWVLL